MATIRLTGYISETGELKVDLPRGLPAGAVEVTIDLPIEQPTDEEHTPFTEAEIAAMLDSEPMTSAEVVAWLQAEGGWQHKGIADSVEWLEEQRRKRREQKRW